MTINRVLQSHLSVPMKYCIQPNYCTYPYKHTVRQFHSLQDSVSLNFVRLRILYVLSYANPGKKKRFTKCLFPTNIHKNFLNICVNLRLGQGCCRSDNFHKCHGGNVHVLLIQTRKSSFPGLSVEYESMCN